MKTTSNTPARRRFASVLATVIVLALIALTPAYVASILTQNPTDNDASSVITISEVGPKPLETVLVADSMTENDVGDESTVTTGPHEERTFTVIVDDDATDILDKSDYFTVIIDGETDYTAKNVTWIDSDCRIYMGPYNSEDTSAYQKYTGAVRVVDEENRTSNDDCTLYWVDAVDGGTNP